MIKSINKIQGRGSCRTNYNQMICWFELFPNFVIFSYFCPFHGFNDHTIVNPDRDCILKAINDKDLLIEGLDLRYLVENYICKDLVVPTI